jgi:hypothetical protein
MAGFQDNSLALDFKYRIRKENRTLNKLLDMRRDAVLGDLSRMPKPQFNKMIRPDSLTPDMRKRLNTVRAHRRSELADDEWLETVKRRADEDRGRPHAVLPEILPPAGLSRPRTATNAAHSLRPATPSQRPASGSGRRPGSREGYAPEYHERGRNADRPPSRGRDRPLSRDGARPSSAAGPGVDWGARPSSRSGDWDEYDQRPPSRSRDHRPPSRGAERPLSRSGYERPSSRGSERPLSRGSDHSHHYGDSLLPTAGFKSLYPREQDRVLALEVTLRQERESRRHLEDQLDVLTKMLSKQLVPADRAPRRPWKDPPVPDPDHVLVRKDTLRRMYDMSKSPEKGARNPFNGELKATEVAARRGLNTRKSAGTAGISSVMQNRTWAIPGSRKIPVDTNVIGFGVTGV